MSNITHRRAGAHPPDASRAATLEAHGLPRLLPVDGRQDLDAHRSHFGDAPPVAGGGARGRVSWFLTAVGESGLLGRGGASFPTARKLRAAHDAASHSGRTPLVVVNVMEGEPASAKDRLLVQRAPHLVIDGAVAAADAVGASEVVVCVARTDQTVVFAGQDPSGEMRRDDASQCAGHPVVVTEVAAQSVHAAIRERAATGVHAQSGRAPSVNGDATGVRTRDHVAVTVARPPDRYVSGEASALASWLEGGAAAPTFHRHRLAESGVEGRPTLLDNAETFAHLALIARFGPAWFRGLGLPDDPGSALISVSGAVINPGVAEIPLGTALRDVLRAAGGAIEPLQAVLLGGYGGRWVPIDTALGMPLEHGGPGDIGPGIVAALPAHSCGVAETARVVRYMAGESAGQCGPCVFGLPALAGALEEIAWPTSAPQADAAFGQLARWTSQIAGRGACRHPDGVVRLVRSALTTFGPDLDQHRRANPCPHTGRPPVLPIPAPSASHAVPWRAAKGPFR